MNVVDQENILKSMRDRFNLTRQIEVVTGTSLLNRNKILAAGSGMGELLTSRESNAMKQAPAVKQASANRMDVRLITLPIEKLVVTIFSDHLFDIDSIERDYHVSISLTEIPEVIKQDWIRELTTSDLVVVADTSLSPRQIGIIEGICIVLEKPLYIVTCKPSVNPEVTSREMTTEIVNGILLQHDTNIKSLLK